MSTVVKSFLYGVYLAVDTPIKPGGYHRLRVDLESVSLVCNSISVSDLVNEATSIGERVRRGDLSLPSVELGRFLNKALREAFRWCGRVYPSLIVPSLLYAFSLGYTGTESILRDHAQVKRVLENLLSANRPGDIKTFLDALRSVHRTDMLDHLASTDLTGVTLISSTVSFSEVFRVLSSKWPAFTLLDTHEFPVIGLLKNMLNYKKRFKSAEASILATYLDLITPRIPVNLRGAVRELVEKDLASREAAKRLLEVDAEVRRQGFSFNEYVEELAVLTFLAIYEGLLTA
ncbi:hypothetical protein [Thermogladius calderae]|uniref:hypothetical protein n=1 Tax=Thermogladius calderae TaxID=1200300 RepID=UPI00064FB33E|nr:hypothetical protein [Thermogladius calderae]